MSYNDDHHQDEDFAPRFLQTNPTWATGALVLAAAFVLAALLSFAYCLIAY